MSGEWRQARDLLWDLVDACSDRMRRSPHAAQSLGRERDHYALEAVRLQRADTAQIARINAELPRRLAALQGPITW